MRSFSAFLSLFFIASLIDAQEDVGKDKLKENYNKENYNKENYNKENNKKENYNKDDYGGKKEDSNGKVSNKKNAASIFAMEYLPIGHVRTDPIIDQSCLSDHVHTFYGPPKIHPSVTYEELRRNTPGSPHEATSGNVLENQSLYWHPTFYRKSEDGVSKEIVEPDWTTIYYAFQKGTTRSFPEGFRMIAGPFELKPICVDYDKDYDQNGKEKETNKNVTEKEGGSPYDGSSNFPSAPCRELAVHLAFPTCWDGVNLDSNNHRSHMAYGIGLESGILSTFANGNIICPKSHPVLLPQILLFLRFMDFKGDGYELSNGNKFDWHADYIMGWEENFLQEIMDNCQDLKDIPCSSTRLRNIYGSNEKLGFQNMVDVLQQVRVPTADTACITKESINQIVGTPPRGACAGELLSTDSCEQPEFPEEFLASPVEDNKTSAGANPAQGGVVLATFVLSFVLSLL